MNSLNFIESESHQCPSSTPPPVEQLDQIKEMMLQEIRLLREEVKRGVMEELNSFLEEFASLRPEQPIIPKRVPCKGVTGKGTVCRNGAAPGSEYCRMHGECIVKTKPVKKPKKIQKPKKIKPEHNHGLYEEPLEICKLCETHGNVLDPRLTEMCFEGDDVN